MSTTLLELQNALKRPKDGYYKKCDKSYTINSLKQTKALPYKRNEILREYSKKFDNLFFFDINQFACPLGVCSYYYKNVKLFSDNVHFSQGGLTLLTREMLQNFGVPRSIEKFFLD